MENVDRENNKRNSI